MGRPSSSTGMPVHLPRGRLTQERGRAELAGVLVELGPDQPLQVARLHGRAKDRRAARIGVGGVPGQDDDLLARQEGPRLPGRTPAEDAEHVHRVVDDELPGVAGLDLDRLPDELAPVRARRRHLEHLLGHLVAEGRRPEQAHQEGIPALAPLDAPPAEFHHVRRQGLVWVLWPRPWPGGDGRLQVHAPRQDGQLQGADGGAHDGVRHHPFIVEGPPLAHHVVDRRRQRQGDRRRVITRTGRHVFAGQVGTGDPGRVRDG